MLVFLAWISLIAAFICAFLIALDETLHPQKMWIMNVVWPVTALYFSVFALWGYLRIGRQMRRAAAPIGHMRMSHQTEVHGPTWRQAAVSTSHCGAGCTLGDIAAEFSLAGLGVTLLGPPLYAAFCGDLLLAWLLGIAFQYFTIKPMHNLSWTEALIAALKADTLSILAFEIGLFGWMAFTYFVLFPRPHLTPGEPAYWFMMQIGMVCGFFTSLPMNQVLLRWGTKETMG